MKLAFDDLARGGRPSAVRAWTGSETRSSNRRERVGIAESLIADILDELEPETGEPVEDLYLRVVSRYVAALGGRVEVRAVFGDEQAVLWSDPGRLPPSQQG